MCSSLFLDEPNDVRHSSQVWIRYETRHSIPYARLSASPRWPQNTRMRTHEPLEQHVAQVHPQRRRDQLRRGDVSHWGRGNLRKLRTMEWRKPSHSGTETNCVEVTVVPNWRKSIRSGEETNCVEVACLTGSEGIFAALH